MNQVSSTLRKVEGGFAHWCPGCEQAHILPESWTFDGNLEAPTFTPSFKHSGFLRVFVDGRWTGEWKRDSTGNTFPYVCHYNLTSGKLNFCNDCTHALASKVVPLPPLPSGFTDSEEYNG